ncbi:DUF4913 domain-containing protein [Streptomyces sp. HPF1205]|uniref:DUF4913 domain-containing protein n=1 Tax=Streptomyces sp. HPF1205 TaxID=2873262 RepID=UPI001CEDD823|nr:DUF4913 domain-containing protein [Streptomyces sp. HPF1205]
MSSEHVRSDTGKRHDAEDPGPEPVHVPDGDLDDLTSALARTMAEVRQHGIILDRLRSEPEPGEQIQGEGETAAAFIPTMEGQPYATELAALTDWVNHLLLPVYGREISPARPWCERWHEHPEAVARLHALWLAWRHLTTSEAGLTGPSTWHRDHLDHALLQLRAPDGPFAACTTNPDRTSHRLLPSPAPGPTRADPRSANTISPRYFSH